MRAVSSLVQEPLQIRSEDGADVKPAEKVTSLISSQSLIDGWVSQASDVLKRVPTPVSVQHLISTVSSASLGMEQNALEDSSQQNILWIFVYLLIYLLWILLFIGLFVGVFVAIGYFYTSNKQYADVEESLATPEQQESFGDWKFGFCSCLGDLEVCCCACMCPCIRWGETLSLVDGLIIFWVGFGIYFAFTVLGWATSVYICWMLLALICTAYRQELRSKFQMKNQGGMTYITDCLLYAFCACCAMSQEARHVEEAFKYGHKAVRKPEKE